MKAFSKFDIFYILVVAIVTIISIIIMLNINYICPFRAIFKIWCPGCGGTRMVFSILDGDFYQAFRYNPLIFILMILGIIFVIVELIYYIKKKSLIKIPQTVDK